MPLLIVQVRNLFGIMQHQESIMRLLVFISFSILAIFILQAQIQFEPAPDFFKTKRQLPLVELSTSQTLYVSDYGAVPNDGLDDLNAIKTAVLYANLFSNASNPVKLVFEKGIYDIFPPLGTNYSLVFSGVDNVVVDGNDSEIIIHNPETGFIQFTNCTNVIFKNISVDYNKLPFTQGKVTAINLSNKTFDFTIDPGFPSLEEAYFVNATQKWGMLKEASGKLKNGVDHLFPYYGWTKISEHVFRVSQPGTGKINQFSVGDYFVQIARNNGKSLFYTSNCKNITFLNVTSYASPSGTYIGYNNYEWNIINCKIIPKEGRVQSANADCIHSSGNFIGPWVQGCHFEAYSDDAVNLKYMTREITSVISLVKLKIKWELGVGDSLCFYNPRDGVFLGEATVTNVTSEGNFIYEITLSNPIDFSQVSSHQTSDKLYVKTRSNDSFVFRNNTFLNGRRYGLLLQNSYGVIENCLFKDLSNCGIRIENLVDWGEGFVANNIVISNNTFQNCGFDLTFINEPVAAAITSQITKLSMPCSVGTTWCGFKTASWQGHRNIAITNNIINYNKSGLHLENINDLLLKDNILNHNDGDITGALPVPFSINNCIVNEQSTLEIITVQNSIDESISYPSIVVDNIYFKKKATSIQIYNIAGLCLLNKEGSFELIDLSFLNSGLYIIKVDGKIGKVIKK